MGYSKNQRAVERVYDTLIQLDGTAQHLSGMDAQGLYAVRNGIAALGDHLLTFPELHGAYAADYRFISTKEGVMAIPRVQVVRMAPAKAALVAPGNAVAALHLIRTQHDKYDHMEFTLEQKEVAKLLAWQEQLNLNVTMEVTPTGIMVKKESHAK